jgi:hypothetical protein
MAAMAALAAVAGLAGLAGSAGLAGLAALAADVVTSGQMNIFMQSITSLEQHILDPNAGKQLS